MELGGKSGHGAAPVLLWTALAAFLIALSWTNIVTLSGWDPDDQLRLVQLRDFLAGQSWFDTTQYRLNAPYGGPMHWSRLIELPLAALILLLRPLFGQTVAEMIAGTVVPLACYALVAFVLFRISRRIGGAVAGYAAIIAAMVAPALSVQLRPMRIDHHGWQLVCAALALWTLYWRDARKAGAAMGIALAIWVHISLEGAPAAAAFFGLLALRWIGNADERTRLAATVGAFAVASLLLFFGTQPGGMAAASWCDTVSPPHIWTIGAASLTILLATRFTPDRRGWRIAAVAVTAIAAGAILFALAPQCTGGAFVGMDPVVREYWYARVREGLPVWRQQGAAAALFIGVPLAGLAVLPWLRRALTAQQWRALAPLTLLQVYAFALSLLVFRTVSTASLFAIPALAIATALLFERYRREPRLVWRLGCVAGMIFLLMPGAILQRGYLLVTPQADAQPASDGRETANDAPPCNAPASLATLGRLPDANIVAPFDLGPLILATSPHRVLASSHHRNQRGMRDHIDIFRLPPAQSATIVRRRKLTHIAVCADEPEMKGYAKTDPDGLGAMLAKGAPPDWLEPLPDMGNGIKVWRVRVQPAPTQTR